MIKLIAIDLDGTLLDGQKKISLKNKRLEHKELKSSFVLVAHWRVFVLI